MLCFRKLLGSFNFTTVVFLPGLISSVVAILIEKKGRRSTLALYMTNLVSYLLAWKNVNSSIQVSHVEGSQDASVTQLYLNEGNPRI